MSIRKKDIVCPNCGKLNTWTDENKFRPFCSERCKLIDLGDWASEKYRVQGEESNSQAVDDESNENNENNK